MPVVEASIVINAPVERVFDLMDDPQRVVEYVPGIVRVSDFDRTPQRVGDSARVTYSVLGLRFPTRVTWHIDYTMKGGILGKAVNALLVQRLNEKNVERSLENLKLICEAA